MRFHYAEPSSYGYYAGPSAAYGGYAEAPEYGQAPQYAEAPDTAITANHRNTATSPIAEAPDTACYAEAPAVYGEAGVRLLRGAGIRVLRGGARVRRLRAGAWLRRLRTGARVRRLRTGTWIRLLRPAAGYGNYAEAPEYGYYAEAPEYGYYAEPPEYGYYAEAPEYGEPGLLRLVRESCPKDPYGNNVSCAVGYYAEEPPGGLGEDPPDGLRPPAGDRCRRWSATDRWVKTPPCSYGEPDLSGYVRAVRSQPFNAGCPMPTNTVGGFEEAPEYGYGGYDGYTKPTEVSPRCDSFTEQPGPTPGVPETFKPLW